MALQETFSREGHGREAELIPCVRIDWVRTGQTFQFRAVPCEKPPELEDVWPKYNMDILTNLKGYLPGDSWIAKAVF